MSTPHTPTSPAMSRRTTTPPTPEQIDLVSSARKLDRDAAAALLSEMRGDLRERFVQAAREQTESVLHDPIEDDPQVLPLLRDAFEQAQAVAEGKGIRGMGSCHYVWMQAQWILLKKHGITWFTPAEMNPDVLFD